MRKLHFYEYQILAKNASSFCKKIVNYSNRWFCHLYSTKIKTILIIFIWTIIQTTNYLFHDWSFRGCVRAKKKKLQATVSIFFRAINIPRTAKTHLASEKWVGNKRRCCAPLINLICKRSGLVIDRNGRVKQQRPASSTSPARLRCRDEHWAALSLQAKPQINATASCSQSPGIIAMLIRVLKFPEFPEEVTDTVAHGALMHIPLMSLSIRSISAFKYS